MALFVLQGLIPYYSRNGTAKQKKNYRLKKISIEKAVIRNSPGINRISFTASFSYIV
jgi:hypothetical protein